MWVHVDTPAYGRSFAVTPESAADSDFEAFQAFPFDMVQKRIASGETGFMAALEEVLREEMLPRLTEQDES